MKHILILSSSKAKLSDEIIEDFTAKINKSSMGSYICEVAYFRDLTLRLGEFPDVYFGQKQKSITEYDYVYIKTFKGYEEMSIAVAHILRMHKIPFVTTELLSKFAHTKLAEYAILSCNKISIPHSLYVPSERQIEQYEYYQKELGEEFIYKAIDGSKSRLNFLIRSKADFFRACESYPEREFIAQEMIKNEGDFRVLIVNNKVDLIFYRKRTSTTTHLNNVSRGARTSKIGKKEFGVSNLNMCIDAAKYLGREIAGVDFVIESRTKKPYVFEVNTSPQVTSGSYVEDKVKIYSDYFRSI